MRPKAGLLLQQKRQEIIKAHYCITITANESKNYKNNKKEKIKIIV